MDVDVTAVPRREAGMEPFEVMTSESQERMLAIVEPERLDEVLAICERWEVRATVIGRVTRARPRATRREAACASSTAGTARCSPTCRPRRCTRTRRSTTARWPRPPTWDEATRARPGRPCPRRPMSAADLLDLLADTSWVWSQYDHQLFLNTVEGPGGDATVLRLKHPVTGVDTGRGLALTTDGNHRWCAVDPRRGTALTVAESVLNLAVRRRPAAGPGQLPQLRQPRAP